MGRAPQSDGEINACGFATSKRAAVCEAYRGSFGVAKPQALFAVAVCWGIAVSFSFTQSPDRVEMSVDRALGFLKIMQEPDGAWQAQGEKNAGVTGLAVLAFLSAGHVPGEGLYGPTLDKAIRWVLDQQKPHGLIATTRSHEMYHHGICTLMLAEVAGMTDSALSKEMKPKLEKAVALILQAQNTKFSQHKGGWRYRVDSTDADVSVTGWQLLALRAARNLGCDVPAERIDLAMGYLERCRDPATGGYAYMPGGRQTPACTGTCILALELRGKERHRSRESLQAGSFLLKHKLAFDDEHFFYSVYYTSQAMFQLGNNYWHFYRPQLHKVLFAQQKPNGSWIANDHYGPAYGTAMGVLALTVEYRFLPIYQRNEEPEK